VTGGIATAELPVLSSFEKYSVISISGNTDLNGEARISDLSGYFASWPTTAADGVKSGTIAIKYAPVGGWQEVFTGTNVAVFRSTDVRSSGFYLRVDDTGTQFARVVGHESMTDVDTGSNPFPTAEQVAGGGYWFKSNTASATAIPYVMTGDACFFTWAAAPLVANNVKNRCFIARGFGDPLALAPTGDAYGCLLGAATSNVVSPVQYIGYRRASRHSALKCKRYPRKFTFPPRPRQTLFSIKSGSTHPNDNQHTRRPDFGHGQQQ
jgi:hypothetical protein